MYSVQFKFIHKQLVRVTKGAFEDSIGEVQTVVSGPISRSYDVKIDDSITIVFDEDELELVDQPVDLTQPAEVEACVCDYMRVPEWAIGVSDGIQVGSQLRTRDGRKLGNAHVSGPRIERSGKLFWPIETDFGNKLFLSDKEIDEFFYPPEWRMAVPVVKRFQDNDLASVAEVEAAKVGS